MRILVLGGAGFIGSNLCKRLIELEHEVICIDNFSLGCKENLDSVKGNRLFTLKEADAYNAHELDEIFRDLKPEYVFHLAANSDIQASSSNPEIEYRNTYSTTFNVLNSMRRFSVKKLFFASTSAVYGDKRGEILTEDTTSLSPVSYYGAAKLGSEALINAFSHMNDMDVLVFRFPNVIGPNLTHGVIYDFMKRLRDNPSKLMILGDGNQTKPYIYVEDLIDAIIKFMYMPKGVSLYNVSASGTTSVKTIADIICEEMGLSGVAYDFTGGEGGWKGDVPRFQYNTDKIKRSGWSAKYTSDEAVRLTVRANIKGSEG